MSEFQHRYLEHRARKAVELSDQRIRLSRRSRRRFVPGVPLRRDHKLALLRAVADAPSSCNRSGIGVEWIDDNAGLAQWEQNLVGGKRWAHRGSAIMLFWASSQCYSHHDPAVGATLADQDGAFAAAMAHVEACRIGVASCYVCPNLTEWATGSPNFYNGSRFVGALVVGYPVFPDLDAPPKRSAEEVLL